MADSTLQIIHYLASRYCAGRRTGTEGSINARKYIIRQMQDLGILPFYGEEYIQPLLNLPGGIEGANILGYIPGRGHLKNRYIMIEAHYDHLGLQEEDLGYFPGADDNAAAIGIILKAAGLFHATPPEAKNWRSILVAFFDAEEPPFFNSPYMGIEHFCHENSDVLQTIDLAIFLDLIGHGLGSGTHEKIMDSFFLTGAEKCYVYSILTDLETAIEGIYPRQMGIHAVPPSGNYLAFKKRERPFIFATCGRNHFYHTLFDSAEKLDYPKINRLALYFSHLLCALSTATPSYFVYNPKGAADAESLKSLKALFQVMDPNTPNLTNILKFIEKAEKICEIQGNLPPNEQSKFLHLVSLIEHYVS
ncbi:MAG: M28 family peptidase [Candidatus Marinimicrobia bacterium]|nr:M28 family peptidase [Candidatus Neomarinimicrobiota bacterium]MDD5581678.1 M28 family peptidase [Candidatus Neomarinimicrobiota bacterium]